MKLLVPAVLLAVAAAAASLVVRSGGAQAAVASRGGRGALVAFGHTGFAYGLALPLNVGHSGFISGGPLLVRNTGDRPLVLARLGLVGPQKGITFRSAYVVGPVRCSGSSPRCFPLTAGYLAPRDRHPLRGATVAPHTQVLIAFGAKVTKPGRHTWRGEDILYHDRAGAHRLRIPVAMALCAPAAKYSHGHSCSPPSLLPG